MTRAQPVSDLDPILSIKQVASFFNKTTYWIRWCESVGYFQYSDGRLIVPSRVQHQHKANGDRRYSYKDVEDMTESLKRKGKIPPGDYSLIKARVLTFRTS
jgi:hypothetical protein